MTSKKPLHFDPTEFIGRQLHTWPTARDNHAALSQQQTRLIESGRQTFIVQHNPARAISSGAKVDSKSIAARPCFLCQSNRPAQQIQTDTGDFSILVNPYPILPDHLVIAHRTHTPQTLRINEEAMISTADILPGFTILYNGPRCGASAPDHLHFQAVRSESLPLWQSLDQCLGSIEADTTAIADAVPACLVMRSRDPKALSELMSRTMQLLPEDPDGPEPMVNAMLRRTPDNEYQAVIVPRRSHRPHDFSFDTSDTTSLFISPGAVDMCGVIVCPRHIDYDRLTADRILGIFHDVTYSYPELCNIYRHPHSPCSK